MGIKEIITKIKEKKELSGLDDSVVKEVLDKLVLRYKLNLTNLNKSSLKLIVKETRAELRKYVGRFAYSNKHRYSLLNEDKINDLIKTHQSSYERTDFYPVLRDIINKLGAKSILDLGCGLNPIALAAKEIEYYACDINNNDISIVNDYFVRRGINGKAYFCDLRKEKTFPAVDLCLAMKVFDILEKRGHKLAEKIIKSIDCKYFIISFSTKTISGKPMNHPQRGWIERLLDRLGFKFNSIKSDNEIYYIASKEEIKLNK